MIRQPNRLPAGAVLIRRVEPRDRDEWLRMRLALWPDCPQAEQHAEMDECLHGSDPVAVFVAERAEGGL